MLILVKLLRPIRGKRYPPSFYNSRKWRDFMAALRMDRGYICECCHGKGWEGHHRFYPERQGEQKPKYITLLCGHCHWCVHKCRWLLPLRYALGRILHG